jgi:tetratricopeptide (TPR) repeat protein
MLGRVLPASLLVLVVGWPLVAQEPSWERKTVILVRPGVKLEIAHDEKIAPKTAGTAKDLTFHVQKEQNGRLRVSSRRQEGWIAKEDAVLFDQAVDYFTKQLAADPKNSHAYLARGLASASKKDSANTLADFTKAIELDPKATLAYYHRANHFYGNGQYDQALADYNTVIQNDPEFDWAYHVRGWIYYRKKDYDKALADYETAIRLVPTETVFYRDRGNVALMRKQHDQALADYSKSIELDPKYAVPWLQRGKTWAAKKEYAKALGDYEQAARLSAKDSFASIYTTPLALFLAGCPDDKLRDGKRALELAQKSYGLTKSVNELAAVAAAHSELGQFDAAIQWQTKAVDAAMAGEKDQHRDRLKLYQERKPYRID